MRSDLLDVGKRVAYPVAVVATALMIVTAAVAGAGILTTGDPTEYVDDLDPTAEAEALGFVTAAGVAGAAVLGYVAGNYVGSINEEKWLNLDAKEAKIGMHEQANQIEANQDVISTAYGNYLEDTRSTALMVGRNAYIKAIDSGNVTDAAGARLEAREAIEDYYAVKQKNLISAQNVVVGAAGSMFSQVDNKSEISESFVSIEMSDTVTSASDRPTFNYSTSTTLLNGSTANVSQIHYDELKNCGACSPQNTNLSILNSELFTGGSDYPVSGVTVQGPTDSYSAITYGNFSDLSKKYEKIEQQNQAVQDEITDIVNGTYEAVQTGRIDSSDLVDPYLGIRNYDPTDDGESYSYRTLAAMGILPPSNVSDQGRMCLDVNGTERCGLLMSDGAPNSSVISRETKTPGDDGKFVIDPVDSAQANQSGTITFWTETPSGTEKYTRSYESGAASDPTSVNIDSGTSTVRIEVDPANGNGLPALRMIKADGSIETLFEANLLAEPKTKAGFAVGGSYDPSNIAGPQFLVTDDGQQYDITEPFTLKNASLNGQEYDTGEMIAYDDPDYSTADVEENVELMDRLAYLENQVDALEKQAVSGGSGLPSIGDFSLFGLGNLKSLLLVVFGGLAILVLLGRN